MITVLTLLLKLFGYGLIAVLLFNGIRAVGQILNEQAQSQRTRQKKLGSQVKQRHLMNSIGKLH